MRTILFSFCLLMCVGASTYAQKPNENELGDGLYANLETNRGEILLQLYYLQTPITVANFVGLATGTIQNDAVDKGVPFYDGLVFHRVIPNFMIQGGDPKGNGTGGPGYSFEDEIVNDLKFDGPGVLAMANAGPATNGSQFFITHKETPWLNGHHTIFGHVITGQDVVDAIQQNDTIQHIEIIAVGEDAKKFDAAKVFNDYYKDKAKVLKKSEKLAKKQLKQYKKKANTTESGLMYIIEKPGTGPTAKPGQTVSVHYTGYLLDGTKFDSSVDRGKPISFKLGAGQVIPGWDEGIQLLNKGAKAKFIIPYNLAYGEAGHPPVIPPRSVLIFEVELVDIQ